MEKKWTRRKFLKTGLTGSIVLGSSSVAGRPTANWGDVPEPPDSTSEAFEGPGQEVHCPTLEASTEIKTPRERLSLDGPWSFSYDPRNIGEREEWFHPKAILPEKTVVPGCDQAEDHPSAAMSPEDYEEFHKKNSNPTLYELGVLTELKYPVMAPGWHQKQFGIPPEWQGREIWFHLGGVTPAADFWFNGVKLGSTVSSRCPVRGKVTRLARFGGENTFVVKTYWPKGPRLDGGFDWIGFTGLYRRAWLEAVPRIHVKALHVIGRINPPEATVNFTLAGLAEKQKLLRVSCRIRGINDTRRFSGEIRLEPERAVDGEYSITIPMPGARLWSPQTPNLYQAAVTLFEGDRQIHAAEARFGLREIRCDGLRVLLNGKPIFLRGGCDVHVYPETLAPPASKAFYAERLKKAKKYGFNYTKNCMEIYTREFLDAADEVGYLVCQEMPFGLSGDYRRIIRHEMPKEYADLYLRELANIIRSDRNHPSVIVYSMVSEFPERPIQEVKDNAFKLFCQDLPDLARRLNPGALALDITGTYYNLTGQFPFGPRHTDLIEDYIRDQRFQEPFHPLEGHFEDLDRPFIIHEYNCWTSLPELALKPRYEKIPYRLSRVPEMEQAAAGAGLTHQLPTLIKNSEKLKYLLQKDGLEQSRKNPRISGYHFFLISGYCWCEEGVFNEFYEEPEDLPAEEFRMYNQDTVLLLNDNGHRVFELGQQTPLAVQVSHFGPEPLTDPMLKWQLVHRNKIVREGGAKLGLAECGTLTLPRQLRLTMPSGADAAPFDLRVALRNHGHEISKNHWKIWAVPAPQGGDWVTRIATDLPFLAKAYPQMKPLDESYLAGQPVVAAGRLGPALLGYLEQGGRVVLFSDGVLKDYRPGVEYRPGEKLPAEDAANYKLFRSPAYNMGNHGNTGTVVAPHPALAKLPHEGWCDALFFHLISGAYPLLLEGFHPQHVDPIIRSIGHQNTMLDKAYAFEVGVGRGALLATCLKFSSTYDSCPETRHLLECLLSYAAGSAFAPTVTVTRQKLVSMLMESG